MTCLETFDLEVCFLKRLIPMLDFGTLSRGKRVLYYRFILKHYLYLLFEWLTLSIWSILLKCLQFSVSRLLKLFPLSDDSRARSSHIEKVRPESEVKYSHFTNTFFRVLRQRREAFGLASRWNISSYIFLYNNLYG